MFHRIADKALDIGTGAAALLAGLCLLSIVLFIWLDSLPLFQDLSLADLFAGKRWGPTAGHFNLLPMVVGTVTTSLLAIAIAGPLGLACAIVINNHRANILAGGIRRLIEIFVGMPSVILGLWGLAVLVPLLAAISPPGTSLLAAGIVLALMILPTACLFSLAALEAVPVPITQASAALGLGRWSHFRRIAFPIARGGIATGLCLALARALGETMAVLMVAGNVPIIPDSVFRPVRTLTTNIALEMAYALDTHRSALFFSGFLVLALSLGLVLASAHLRKTGASK